LVELRQGSRNDEFSFNILFGLLKVPSFDGWGRERPAIGTPGRVEFGAAAQHAYLLVVEVWVDPLIHILFQGEIFDTLVAGQLLPASFRMEKIGNGAIHRPTNDSKKFRRAIEDVADAVINMVA
jgi:hypothetical protein